MLIRRAVLVAGTVIALVALAIPAAAQQFPEFTAPLVDEADVVPPAVEAELNAEIQDFQDRTGNQIAVAVIKTTGGREIETYSRDLANYWGIGSADLDNGVVLLLATEDRRLRIEVGLGLEELLTDETATTIIDEDITPFLRDNDLSTALRNGIGGIESALEGGYAAPPIDEGGVIDDPSYEAPDFNNGSDGAGDFLGGMGGLVVLFVIVAAGAALARGGVVGRGGSSGFWSSQQHHHWHHHHDSWSGGGFGGGGFGGSSGGGGGGFSGGGGGGGGSFGGGGASGSW